MTGKRLDITQNKAAEPIRQQVALERCAGLEIRLDTPKGRGVFATQVIASGAIIDICPVLVLSHDDNKHVAQSSLYHYSYNWPVTEANGQIVHHQAIIFGLGSMFNHSSSAQNVVWRRDLALETVVYTALGDIQPGEELCISYGSNLWFKDADTHINVQETERDVLSAILLGVEGSDDLGSCNGKS